MSSRKSHHSKYDRKGKNRDESNKAGPSTSTAAGQVRPGEWKTHKTYRSDDDRGRSLHRYNDYEEGREPSQHGYYHQDGGLVMTPDAPMNSFEFDMNRNQENSSPEPPGRSGEFHPTRRSRAHNANRGVLSRDDVRRKDNRAREERRKRGSGCVIF